MSEHTCSEQVLFDGESEPAPVCIKINSLSGKLLRALDDGKIDSNLYQDLRGTLEVIRSETSNLRGWGQDWRDEAQRRVESSLDKEDREAWDEIERIRDSR